MKSNQSAQIFGEESGQVSGFATRTKPLPYRILLLNWRDPQHPKAGGAETLTMNWAQAWVEAGADVTLLANAFPGCLREDCAGGIRIVRSGNPLTQAWHALSLYRREGPFDLVVEEINTLPFFSSTWAKNRSILLMHQLARGVWFYESRWPVSLIGYLMEPLYLRTYSKCPALVLSESTRQDLIGLGFRADRIHIVPGATEVARAEPGPRDEIFSFIYAGRLTPSKRIDHIIKAFAIVHRSAVLGGLPSRLRIVGGGSATYERHLKSVAAREGVGGFVEFYGWVDKWWRDRRLAGSHVLVMASVREGWGLVVTEANSVGIPAIGYPVQGLRDSIQHGVTGLIAQDQTPKALAREMLELASSNELWSRLSSAAFCDSVNRDWGASRNMATHQLALAATQLR